MIYLQKITLKDFLSHEVTEISFKEGEQLLIDGASGAGKSTIFDAIIWALYGEGRVDNRSLVRRGAKKASVILELVQTSTQTTAKDIITIERSTNAKGKHELNVSVLKEGESAPVAHPLTGVRELQNWIDKELVGASYLLFVNSVAYVQGNTERFVSQPAPKRKELLLEIVKADDYGKYYEGARATLSRLDGEGNKAQGALAELQTQAAGLTTRIEGRDAHMTVLSAQALVLKDISPRKLALEESKAKNAAIAQNVKLLTDVFNAAVLDAQRHEKAMKETVDKVSLRDKLMTILRDKPAFDEELNTTLEKVATLRTQLETATEVSSKRNEYFARKPIVIDRTKEIERYESQMEVFRSRPVCPAGDKCPYHKDVDGQLKYGLEQVADLTAQSIKEQVALAAWILEESNIPAEADMRTLMQEIRSTDDHLQRLGVEERRFDATKRDLEATLELEKTLPGILEEMNNKWTAVDNAKKQMESATNAINGEEIGRINADLTAIQAEETAANEKITRATVALDNIEKDSRDLTLIEGRISEVLVDTTRIQEQARKVGLVKDAFGSKGIETIVIDYLLPKLEDRINDVLSKLSDFRVRLDTQRPSADGLTMVEGLFITILNEMSEEMPYEAYSGGEKLKISVSISEALATLQKVGFRLFDETFMGLDENSTESFADVLVSLQQHSGQILCISHLLQIKDLFDKKLFITKTNGVSHV